MRSETPNPVDRAMEIVRNLQPYKERSPKLKTSDNFPGRTKLERGEALYSNLINEWIPGQPDSRVLMELFILLNFSALAFVELVITGELDVTLRAHS